MNWKVIEFLLDQIIVYFNKILPKMLQLWFKIWNRQKKIPDGDIVTAKVIIFKGDVNRIPENCSSSSVD